MKEQKNTDDKLCDYLCWAASQMKSAAGKTSDPTLKTKYEQLAGINKQYRDRCKSGQNDRKNLKLTKEIELLKSALFCQKAVFDAFSIDAVENADALTDEVLDRQKEVCRELVSEIEKRQALF